MGRNLDVKFPIVDLEICHQGQILKLVPASGGR